jgi:hypothetical protein
MWPPSSGLKTNFKSDSAAYFMLVSCFAYSSTLKMEAKFSNEMSAEFQWAMWCYIPELALESQLI